MPRPEQVFREYRRELQRSLQDPNLERGLERSVRAARMLRERLATQFPDTEQRAEEMTRVRRQALERLDELVEQASKSLQANGIEVHLAETASDALRVFDDIVGSGKVVVSGKTMTGEEIGLRHHLQAQGNEYWETDIGEFIQQIRDEKPMHYVGPSLHVSREEAAKLLSEFFGTEVSPDIPTEIRAIREFLRRKYFEADVGVTGCNVLAADTGSIFLIENEGNIRMSSTVPPVHVVLVGIDKILPTLDDAFKMATSIWRNIGFTVPQYVSIVSGPSASGDIELTMVRGASGPLEVHVVLLDNGRSILAKDPVLRDALLCIKCGNCLLECSIFQGVAGHFGGPSYLGGLGAVLTAFIGGDLEQAMPAAYTCLRCGRCGEICPISIDTPTLVAELRRRIVESSRK
jgi:L-lactate dehydrogenase complex protein LldG